MKSSKLDPLCSIVVLQKNKDWKKDSHQDKDSCF